jgi:HEAT repeat protein
MVALLAMQRSTFLIWLWAVPALAGSAASNAKAFNKMEEAKSIADSFITGTATTSISNACNRLKFLGQEPLASRVWAGAIIGEVVVEKRRVLAEGLAILANREGTPGLMRALSDDDGAVRMYGCQGLGRVHVKDAEPKIATLLGDKTLGVRREAARALGQFHDARWGVALVKAAKVEDDAEVKAAMLVAAGQCGDKKQSGELEKYLTGSSETARFAAAQGLVMLGAPAGMKFAKDKLGSKDKFDRIQGLQLFEGSKAKEVDAVLEPMLKDPDRGVQATAARILYQGGDAKKLDWLVVESFKANGEDRLPYERELETLRLTDEDRKAILNKAGIK